MVLSTRDQHHQVRSSLANVMVTTRGPEVTGGELPMVGDGDEGTAHAEKELRWPRSLEEVRIEIASSSVAWCP